MARTSYRVKILDEQEWNELVKSHPRFAHVDESNLGFADRQSGRGYVREEFLKTFPGAKSYLLQHEFDHLVESEPTDVDEYGICHKKFFKDFLAPVGLPILGALLGGPIGGALGAGAGGLTGLGTAVASGLGGAAGGAAGQAIHGGNVGQGALLGGLGGALAPSVGPALSAVGRGVSGFGGGVGQAVGGALKGIGGFLGGGQPPLTTSPGLGGAGTAGAPPAGTFGSTASRLFGGGGLTGSPLVSDTAQFGGSRGLLGQFTAAGFNQIPPSGSNLTNTLGADAALQRLLGNAQQTTSAPGLSVGQRVGLGLGAAGLGTGLALFGQRAKQGQPPQIPELSQIPAVQRFHTETQNRLGPLVEQLGGLTPQLQGFQSQLAGLQNVPLPENLRASVARPFSQELRDFYSQLAQYQPGADLATNSTYLRGVGDINQRQAEALANAQLAFQAQQRQTIAQQQQGVEQQRQAILSQAGLTQEQLASFHELAQLDIDTIMARTGLRADQANQFKQIFGNLGGAIAGAGIMGAFGGF